MRLLQRMSNGDINLTRNLDDAAIPPYAILSHTWGDESDEVTFDDIGRDRGRSKAGYRKIEFCSEKAARDGLQYFWVDSCCINKLITAELQDAISSMFRWYQRSTKCYVYLSDVSVKETRFTWEQAFRKSRWFTRGWTLQELLAPMSVEFFSREASRLGDNNSLEQQIHEITGISQTALRGEPLSEFSVNDRMSWIGPRQTKLEEDLAYSLLGIFGVNIPLRYGEGKKSAFERLEKEIDKLQKCLQDLRLTDPRYHKKKIEDIKGGLLADSYRWILDNSDFQTWRHDERSRLLWIKGDPGKGKTMLLCGIINELNKPMDKTALLSYFFCEATNSQVNNATAVLRGLIYMLVCQQPSLVSHIRKKYDYAGKALFEDSTAWFALSDMFTDILQDRNLNSTYLIIDALDECVAADLPKLLEFIVKKSSLSSRIKWLVSSRNLAPIEEQLEKAGSKVGLCLELNAESVSAAVRIYIQHKVHQLVLDKEYDDNTQNAILNHLSSNADNTFLWVALVCQNLKNTPKSRTRAKLKSFPPGLDSVYGRMITQICESTDAELCKRILASIATVYEPVNVTELASLVEIQEASSDDVKSLQEIVGLCGSFLVVRDRTVYFVHKSAKDYLLAEASTTIFPSGMKEIHHEIFLRSLRVLSEKLRRNIYDLDSLGYPIEQVQRLEPDPLAALRYSCLYWADHLCESDTHGRANMKISLKDRDLVEVFVREKYLYWLETVSLCKGMSKGVLAMAKLEKLIQGTDAATLLELIHDARRFIRYYKHAIEISPLQAYASVLIFSPSGSLIRRHFMKEEPDWITIKPQIGSQWSTCLQTLEGHSSTVNSVAFSHDSTRLASASDDCTVNIWDAGSGACLQTLKGHTRTINSVAFSHDSMRLASASGDCTVRTWNASSGACLQTLKGHSHFVRSVAFSHKSTQLASASDDCTVSIWDAESGMCLQTLQGHSSTVSSVTFSYDSTRLASASHDRTIKIWDASSGACLQTLKGHSDFVNSVAFSHDSTRLASASDDRTVRLWDASSDVCIRTLDTRSSGTVNSVAFSHDSTRLASAVSDNCTVSIWDAGSGVCLQTLKGHTRTINSVAFSHDSTRLMSASHDRTVRIWDVSSNAYLRTLDTSHSATVSSVAFSRDSTLLASASYDRTIKIWDASSGECLQTHNVGHDYTVNSLAFSQDSTKLRSASDDRTVQIWNVSNSTYTRTRDDSDSDSDTVDSLNFLHDSTRLMSASDGRTARLWGSSSGKYRQPLSMREATREVIWNTETPSLHTDIEPQSYRIALSSSGEWITCNSKNLIWLPPEYRPSCSAVSGRAIGIGVGSGKVWLCNLEVTAMLREVCQGHAKTF